MLTLPKGEGTAPWRLPSVSYDHETDHEREERIMSSNEGGDRLYTTGEIALSMVIVSIVIMLPVIAGAVYYVGWM